jgi:UV DNA damage endonuclease
MRIGYACINMSLKGVTTNRTMIKRTFDSKGIKYCSELAVENTKDLLKILVWNKNNNIFFFRISSDMFPWSSHYNLKDLPDYNQIKLNLKRVGDYATKNNIRLTAHPGPFNVLGSPTESVVQNTIKDLETHAEIFDLMGLSKTPYNKLNIHCNGVYGDKIATMDRFCDNFGKLSESVQKRLTIENDDKESMYSVKDLMYIHHKIKIPIVFDYHHHQFCTGGLSEKEALELAISTWPENITPIVHYSESKAIHESNEFIKKQAHSDYIHKLPDTYGFDLEIMLECKAKDLALLDILKKYK